MARLSSLLILLLWAAPVQAQDKPQKMPLRTKVALACFSVGSYWDAINTAHCSALGTCHEANPLYRAIVPRRGIVLTMTIKGGANTAAAGWVIADSRQHPQRAFWQAFGLCAAQSVVNVANVRTLRKCRA